MILKIGYPVYVKNHLRKNKLEARWQSHYRIIEQTGPVTFIIKNQLTGKTMKSHAEHLRLSNLDWQVPQDPEERNLRRARYVVPPTFSSTDSSSNDDDTDDNTPLKKLIARNKHVRQNSSDEDDIPLMELRQRIKARGKQLVDTPRTKRTVRKRQKLQMTHLEESGRDLTDMDVDETDGFKELSHTEEPEDMEINAKLICAK